MSCVCHFHLPYAQQSVLIGTISWWQFSIKHETNHKIQQKGIKGKLGLARVPGHCGYTETLRDQFAFLE